MTQVQATTSIEGNKRQILGGLHIEAEVTEVLLQLIEQGRRQQDEIIEMNSNLKKVHELQISIVSELQGEITAEMRNDTQQEIQM
jgi:hypothetical protein